MLFWIFLQVLHVSWRSLNSSQYHLTRCYLFDLLAIILLVGWMCTFSDAIILLTVIVSWSIIGLILVSYVALTYYRSGMNMHGFRKDEMQPWALPSLEVLKLQCMYLLYLCVVSPFFHDKTWSEPLRETVGDIWVLIRHSSECIGNGKSCAWSIAFPNIASASTVCS
jgi:glucan phosphoethanolaminetransferase (alkaline phosphatase superfamily)